MFVRARDILNGQKRKAQIIALLCGSSRCAGLWYGYCSVIRAIEVLQRSTNSEPCIMTEKLDVGKALDKLRGSDEPKSRMTVLDEKNKALEEEIRRLRAERLRLERDN